jgi:hypothetical protein
MSSVTLPYPTFPDGSTASGTQVIANLDAIVDVVNGAIDNTNITNASITGSTKLVDATVTAAKLAPGAVIESKADYASANAGILAHRAGPNYAGAGGRRTAWVSKGITPTGSATEEEFTFTFSADCVDGNPAFTSAPQIGPPSFIRNTTSYGEMVAQSHWKTVTTTQAVLRVVYNTAAAATIMTVQFQVSGPIA